MDCKEVEVNGKYVWKGLDKKGKAFCHEVVVLEKSPLSSNGQMTSNLKGPVATTLMYCKVVVNLLNSEERHKISCKELFPWNCARA